MEQPNQLRVCLHRHAGGFAAYQPRIPQKLDGITITMQAADYHSLARERKAIPEAVRIRSVASSNRIAFPPRLLKTAHQHPAGPSAGGAFIQAVPQLFRRLQELQAFWNQSR